MQFYREDSAESSGGGSKIIADNGENQWLNVAGFTWRLQASSDIKLPGGIFSFNVAQCRVAAVFVYRYRALEFIFNLSGSSPTARCISSWPQPRHHALAQTGVATLLVLCNAQMFIVALLPVPPQQDCPRLTGTSKLSLTEPAPSKVLSQHTPIPQNTIRDRK